MRVEALFGEVGRGHHPVLTQAVHDHRLRQADLSLQHEERLRAVGQDQRL